MAPYTAMDHLSLRPPRIVGVASPVIGVLSWYETLWLLAWAVGAIIPHRLRRNIEQRCCKTTKVGEWGTKPHRKVHKKAVHVFIESLARSRANPELRNNRSAKKSKKSCNIWRKTSQPAWLETKPADLSWLPAVCSPAFFLVIVFPFGMLAVFWGCYSPVKKLACWKIRHFVRWFPQRTKHLRSPTSREALEVLVSLRFCPNVGPIAGKMMLCQWVW